MASQEDNKPGWLVAFPPNSLIIFIVGPTLPQCESYGSTLNSSDWGVNRKIKVWVPGRERVRWVGKQMFWPQNCCVALISSSLIAITGFSSTCCSKRNVPGKDERRGERQTEGRLGQYNGWAGTSRTKYAPTWGHAEISNSSLLA